MTKLEGSYVALVTPFKNGEVDLAKVAELVEFHAANGTSGVCPVATTGESPSLSHAEKAEVVKTVVKAAKGRLKVWPGTGTYNTRESVELTKMAKELGADGALMVSPYYNKPTQEGLFRHFEAVAKAVDIPIMLYTVPGRTAVNIAPETTARLAKLKNIVAIKEASGNLEQVTQTRLLCDIQILSGDDALTFPMMCLGATGVVSVAANVAPRGVADMAAAALKGDLAKARELHQKWFPLFKDLFIETSPGPVKTALRKMGMYNGEIRLPLCEMSPANEEKLERTLRSVGLL